MMLKSNDHSKLIKSKLPSSMNRRSIGSRSESSVLDSRRSKLKSRMTEMDRELRGMTQDDDEEDFNENSIDHESKAIRWPSWNGLDQTQQESIRERQN